MESFLSSLSVVRMVKSSLFGPLWVVMAVVLLVHSPVVQACTFWDRSCIDPLSQTAIPVSFRPFLLQDLSLYYAYDTDPSGKGSNPMAKASFWLSFNHARVNQSVIDSNRTSEIAMRVGNLTGTPSGTNNGCDGVWGTGCSNDIKRNLRQAIFHLSTSGESYTQPLASVLNQMVGKQPSFPNCPPQLFDVSNIPVNSMCAALLCLDTSNVKQFSPKRMSPVLLPFKFGPLAPWTSHLRPGISRTRPPMNKRSKSLWVSLVELPLIIPNHLPIRAKYRLKWRAFKLPRAHFRPRAPVSGMPHGG